MRRNGSAISSLVQCHNIPEVMTKKPQLWPTCKAHDAQEWQRHFKPRATPQMGYSCGFFYQR